MTNEEIDRQVLETVRENMDDAYLGSQNAMIDDVGKLCRSLVSQAYEEAAQEMEESATHYRQRTTTWEGDGGPVNEEIAVTWAVAAQRLRRMKDSLAYVESASSR